MSHSPAKSCVWSARSGLVHATRSDGGVGSDPGILLEDAGLFKCHDGNLPLHMIGREIQSQSWNVLR